MIKGFIALISLISSILLSFLYYHISSIKEIWIPIVLFIILFIFISLLAWIIIGILSLTVNKKKEYEKKSKLYKGVLEFGLAFINEYARAKIKITGKELLPKDSKVLIISNHLSNFDPIIICDKLRKYNIVEISKPENFNFPIIGSFMKRNCYLAINRDNPREAVKTINKASDFINSGKYSIHVAPEGTRNKINPKVLLPFKPGAFKIASKTLCPIVIIEMYNTNKIKKHFPFRRTIVELNIIKVLYKEDYETKKTVELSDYCQNLIQKAIDSHK